MTNWELCIALVLLGVAYRLSGLLWRVFYKAYKRKWDIKSYGDIHEIHTDRGGRQFIRRVSEPWVLK